MRRLRKDILKIKKKINEFNPKSKSKVLSVLRRKFNRRKLKLNQQKYNSTYQGVYKRSDSEFSFRKRKAFKALKAQKKAIRQSMKKIKYTGSLVLDLDLTSSNFEKKRGTVTINIRNKSRKEIMQMIKDEKRKYLDGRRISYSDKEYVTVSFPEDQIINDDLTFLTEAWQLMPISKINHGNNITEYESLHAKIPELLYNEYVLNDFKNCFPIYIKYYLLKRNSHIRVINSDDDLVSGPFKLPRNGVSLEEIHDYFMDINCSYVAVDGFDNILSHFVAKNSKYVMCSFAVCNNHVYPISNPSKRRSLSQRARYKKYIRKYDGKKDRPSPEKCTTLEGKLEHMFIESIEKGIIPKHTIINNKFKSVNGVRLVDNDIEEIWNACDVMGTKYRMSSGSILSDHLHKYPKSTLNPNVAEEINNITKVGKLVKYSEFKESTRHIDVKREYTSQLLNIKNWFKFMPYAEIEKFNGKIKNMGFYYIETDDRKLFNGTNWYFGQLLKEAVKDNIPFKCTRQLIASYPVINDSDHVRKFVHAKYIDDRVKKTGINHMIGSFRRTKKSTNYTTITNDLSCVKMMINKYDAEVIKRKKYNMYHVTNKITTEYKNNRQFIFFQIVDMCMLKVYKMTKKLENAGAIIRGIVTDGIYFDEPVAYGKHNKLFDFKDKKRCRIGRWGSDEISDKSREAKITKLLKCNYVPKLTYKKANKNILITGRPGTGKTTLLKKIHGLSKHKIPIMAYTNKASRNVEGVTLNTYFCSEVINRSVISEHDKIYYVDEIYCCPIDLLCHLYICSAYEKNKLICSGDENQLIVDFDERVSKYKDMKLKAIIKLISYMSDYKYKLLTLHRYDPALAKATANHLKPQLSKCTKLKKIPINTEFRHLVYTNDKRYKINKMYQEAGLNNLDISPYISMKTIKKSTKFTKLYSKNEIYTLKEIHEYDWPMKDFEIAWTTTVHKAQGDTIYNKLCIHEIDQMIKNHRLGYTAMTRATCLANLYRC